jgi:hypothetical protein
MSTHTKGPWQAEENTIKESSGARIAYCIPAGVYMDGSYVVSKAEAAANTRLIAAAPELLAFISAVIKEGYLPADVPFAGMTIRDMGELLDKIEGGK